MSIDAISASSDINLYDIDELEEKKPNEDHTNYLNKLRALFARAMEQSMRFSEKDHTSVTELKRDIQKKSNESSDERKSGATVGLWGAAGSVLLQVTRVFVKNDSIRDIMGKVADNGIQAGTNVYATFTNAKASVLDAVVMMRQTDYSNKSQKDSSSTMQQNVQQLNEAAESLLQRASSSN
jgi:hypothetical protein